MMLNQSAVAFNRFISVCVPTANHMWITHIPNDNWQLTNILQFTAIHNGTLIFLTWLVPFIGLLMPLTGTWGQLGYDPGTGTCTFIDDPLDNGIPRMQELNYSLKLFHLCNKIDFRLFLSCGLGFPSIIICFCYLRIYLTFIRSSQRIRSRSVAALGQTSTITNGNRKEEVSLFWLNLIKVIIQKNLISLRQAIPSNYHQVSFNPSKFSSIKNKSNYRKISYEIAAIEASNYEISMTDGPSLSYNFRNQRRVSGETVTKIFCVCNCVSTLATLIDCQLVNERKRGQKGEAREQNDTHSVHDFPGICHLYPSTYPDFNIRQVSLNNKK